MADLVRALQLADAAASSLGMAVALESMGRPYDERVRQAATAMEGSLEILRRNGHHVDLAAGTELRVAELPHVGSGSTP